MAAGEALAVIGKAEGERVLGGEQLGDGAAEARGDALVGAEDAAAAQDHRAGRDPFEEGTEQLAARAGFAGACYQCCQCCHC